MFDSQIYSPQSVSNAGGSCVPIQVVTINEPVKSIDDVIIYKVYDNVNSECNVIYNSNELKISHSIDSICWSCWSDYNTELNTTIDLNTDFFVRFQVQGNVAAVFINDDSENSEKNSSDIYYSNKSNFEGNFTRTFNYSTSLLSGFNFTACTGNSSSTNPNQYNPYANMECAIKLQQQLSETVACMFGIPIYYFKVSGVRDSADITFKEYALKSVTSVKQIKMIIKDGMMPSSKPEFDDWGVDWQNDWEVEISKGMFAAAFGNTEYPTEGDMIYIPMMKRMWSVNEAYDEKNESLMWVSTTFKLALVKYQDEAMIDKNSTESIINSVVKNKYEDLFGDEEGIDSGIEAAEIIDARPNNMTPVYESDACRKYIDVENTEIKNANQNSDLSLYYKGTLVADSYYEFSDNLGGNLQGNVVEYQRGYCGDEMTLSFIVNFDSVVNSENSEKNNVNIYNSNKSNFNGNLITIGNTVLRYKYSVKNDNKNNTKNNVITIIYNNNNILTLNLDMDSWYFVVFRYSKTLNVCDMVAAKYTYPSSIPQYKLRKFHYYFDIDNAQTNSTSYDSEMNVIEKAPVIVKNFGGKLTNIKLFNVYVDDLSEILMQYPTNQHLIINDTARPVYGLLGVKTF